MYPTKSYSGQMNAVPQSTVPAYGGDCALDRMPGVATSTARLIETVAQLNSATWTLREFFGMNTPDPAEGNPYRSGYQGQLDQVSSSARAALENVNAVLEHLQS